jgi:23S rRNA pseudouridine2604 synthase
MAVRLNKFLVDQGVCSRREADRLIGAGQVLVNGAKATLGQKVEGDEAITVQGRAVRTAERPRVYLAYHKPVGIICTSDPKAHDNIIEAIGYPERIFHIGRLDVASSGLIFLTNDGDVVNAILRAEEKHEKEYVVEVDKPVTEAFLRGVQHGVDIGDERPTLPAQIEQEGPRTFRIILIEGRNRQIRRMCDAFGYTVKALQRVRIMHMTLAGLQPGEWRHFTAEELKELLHQVQH